MKILINESSFIKLFEATNLSDIYQKYYSNIPQDEFNEIVSADPTWNSDKPNKMGKYGKWLLSLYMSKRLKLEDLYKAKTYLSYFVKYNNVIDNKDINTYKTLNDLYSVVSNFIENPDQATSKQDAIRKIKEGAEKVYEDNEWLVIIPHTEEASCYYGKGTQWCTAADKGSNMFDHYNEQGNLYININKTTHEKYQFHFETDSFMDETDTPIENPIFKTIGFNDSILEWYKENVKEWQKLCDETITIMTSDDDNDIILRKRIDSEYWDLEEKDSAGAIATDLIINNDIDTNVYQHKLYYEKYATFKNAYGFMTLVSYNNDNFHLYLVGNKYKYINKLNNEYDDEYRPNVIETVDSNGIYELIALPMVEIIYKKRNSDEIHHAKFLTEDIIGIYKKNGLIDLVNYEGYELDDIQLIDGEIQRDDDYMYGTVLDSYGNEVKFDLETLDIEE